MTTQIEALNLAREYVLTHSIDAGQVFVAIEEALAQPEPPPECQTEAEKTAFAFGWFKALEQQRLAQPEQNIPKIGCVNHDCDKCKAQPEQEPVETLAYKADYWKRMHDEVRVELIKALNAQPEQEPVAFEAWYQNAIWGNEDFKAGCKRAWNAAIKTTTPPQRTWVGLDWNEMPEIYMNDKAFEHGAQWAETKLKEKNT